LCLWDDGTLTQAGIVVIFILSESKAATQKLGSFRFFLLKKTNRNKTLEELFPPQPLTHCKLFFSTS
jgi:hypothetical protein